MLRTLLNTHIIIIIIIWLLHNLVEASFDLFRYLLLAIPIGDQLKPWELHPYVVDDAQIRPLNCIKTFCNYITDRFNIVTHL